MAAKIDIYLIEPPEAYTLTKEYDTYIRSLVGYLRDDPSTQTVVIEPETGYLFKFDLTAFLLENSVPLEDHRLIMMVNGITSRLTIDETMVSLRIPNQALITRLKQIYRTALTA